MMYKFLPFCFAFESQSISKIWIINWFLHLQVKRYAKEVEHEKQHHVHYNILPLHGPGVGVTPAIMKLPEV